MATVPVDVDVICIQANVTCPVYELDQCVKVCSNNTNIGTDGCSDDNGTCVTDGVDCCETVTLCLVSGDQVQLETCDNSVVITPALVVVSGTISVNNNSSDPITIISNATLLLENGETVQVVLRGDLTVPPGDLSLSPGESVVLTFVGSFDAALLEDGNVTLQVTYNESQVIEVDFQINDGNTGSECSQTGTQTTTQVFINTESGSLNDPVPTGSQVVITSQLVGTFEEPNQPPPPGNRICPADAEATVTVGELVPTVEATAEIRINSTTDWCVCKTGSICSNQSNCLRSPEFFADNGPALQEQCISCGNGENNEFPEGVTITVAGQELSLPQICAILNVSPETEENAAISRCLGCGINDPTRASLLQLLLVIRAAITLQFNEEVITRCTEVQNILTGLLAVLESLQITLFDDADSPIINQATCADPVPDAVFTNIINSVNMAADLNLQSVEDLLALLTSIFDGTFEDCKITPCPDVPQSECPCDFPTASYTLTLTNDVEAQRTNVVNITVTLEGECLLPYEKTFTYEIREDDSEGNVVFSGEVTFAPGESQKTFEVNPDDLTEGQRLVVVLTWTGEVFNLATCETQSISEGGGSVETDFTVNPVCVGSASSFLTDVTTVEDECIPEFTPELLLPQTCTPTDTCLRKAISDTSIAFEFSDGSTRTFLLCENGELNQELISLLQSIVSFDPNSPNQVDVNVAFNNLLGINEPPCVPDYNMVVIQYVVRLDECVETVTNVARVRNSRQSSTTISSSSVTLNNPGYTPDVVQLTAPKNLSLEKSKQKVITKRTSSVKSRAIPHENKHSVQKETVKSSNIQAYIPKEQQRVSTPNNNKVLPKSQSSDNKQRVVSRSSGKVRRPGVKVVAKKGTCTSCNEKAKAAALNKNQKKQ